MDTYCRYEDITPKQLEFLKKQKFIAKNCVIDGHCSDLDFPYIRRDGHGTYDRPDSIYTPEEVWPELEGLNSPKVKIVKVSDLSKQDIEKLKTYPGADQKAMLICNGETSWNFVDFTGNGYVTKDYTTIVSKEEMWPILFAKEESGKKSTGATKDDNNKSERPELIEAEFIKSLSRVMAMGAKKYAANQWKQGGEGFDERLYGAALRHLLAWRSGEKIDPESGESHLSHVTANMMMLHWYDNDLTR